MAYKKTNSKTKNNINVKAKKVVKDAYKKHPVLVICLVVIILAVIIGGYFAYQNYQKKKYTINDELSFHFIATDNDHSGDCIYIKAGDNDILIDAGSEDNSMTKIKSYVNRYCTDGVLEYVIATHADSDHIACFGMNNGVFDEYECKVIIDFPKTNKNTQTYLEYKSKREKEVQEGATHYTALECYNEENGAKKVYSLTDSISMEILYNEFYEKESNKENNYSVCIMFHHGGRNFLFTGDLEENGEKKLVENNNLKKVDLFKAGHHGSSTSSNIDLLEVINPDICVVTCVAGDKYGFPTQDFIDRISNYTTNVYVNSICENGYTSNKEFDYLNGDIIVSSSVENVKVECSNNQTLLKDTVWFADKRITPKGWQ